MMRIDRIWKLSSFWPSCQNCDRPSKSLFCTSCAESLTFQNACVECGRILLAPKLLKCIPCAMEKRRWNSLSIAFFYLDGVQRFIREIKDLGRPERFRELSQDLLPPPPGDCDLIVAVSSDPLHDKKRLFNPAEALAKHLSQIWKIRFQKSSIFHREPFLQSQRELDRETRMRFLKRVVRLHPERPRQNQRFKRVLLVDDVMTTGATLEIHSRLLQKISDEVHIFCLARTIKKFG